MADNDNEYELERSKLGITQWISAKFLRKEKARSPVDNRFLSDLHDLKKVGRYEIVEKIGQGSMGIVYKGLDPYIKRDVGIKISRPHSDASKESAEKYRQSFFTEAQRQGA